MYFFLYLLFMDPSCRSILNISGINFEGVEELNNQMFERDLFLRGDLYEKTKPFIPEVRKIFSSSLLTSLQETAIGSQKWPLLNLVRQILNGHGFIMEPFRKCDGYDKDGKKRFKRFFVIKKRL